MPLRDADRLLRGKLRGGRETAALRTALDEAVASGKAGQIDYVTLNVMDGDRSDFEGFDEEHYDAQWNIGPAEDGQPSVRTTETGIRNIGCLISAGAELSSDGHAVDTDLTVQWTELSGITLWKAGTTTIEQPVFATIKTTRFYRMETGEWNLYGVLPTYAGPGDELQAGVVPAAPDRVFLLTRATVDSRLPGGGGRDAVSQCVVFCEWISTDAATVAALKTRFPEPASGEAMREALEAELDKGTAVLEDIASVPVVSAKKGKNETVCDVPRPAKFKINATVPPEGTGQSTVSLRTASHQRTIEVEASRISGKKEWHLSLDPVGGGVPGPGDPPKAKGTGKDPAHTENDPQKAKDTGKDSAQTENDPSKAKDTVKDSAQSESDPPKAKDTSKDSAQKENDPSKAKGTGKDSAQTEKSKCALDLLPDTTVLAVTLPKPAKAGNEDDLEPPGKDKVTLLFVKLFE